ncbi:MAG: sortase [Gaiellaceae bacterium]
MTRRRLGTVLIVVGLLVLAYAAAVLFWRDPVTDVYNRYQQNRLGSELQGVFEDFEASAPAAPDLVSEEQERSAVSALARRFGRTVELGQPLGRIEIPRIGVEAVFVHGTRWGPDLSRGPGHYERTSLPGLGGTVGIAGHRTTFGAPFRKIDKLERGDAIVLELPYGTFHYRIFEHEIVESDDWSVVRNRGFDTVMLSACHPLYSAAQRWIVYGRLVDVEPIV